MPETTGTGVFIGCFQSWAQITAEVNYTERYVHMKHGAGFRAVQEMLDEREG
ncbi:MAG: hypothetical protein IJQ71_08115 [Clostridia bacterium]|nr:hypothetical protein [Clostridia bacterium]